MRKVFIIILASCQLLVAFSPLLPYVDYYLNQSYIIQKLCVNRDTPSMECNGKCYLTRRIQESVNTESTDPIVPPKITYEEPEPLALKGSTYDLLTLDISWIFPHSEHIENQCMLIPTSPPPKSERLSLNFIS